MLLFKNCLLALIKAPEGNKGTRTFLFLFFIGVQLLDANVSVFLLYSKVNQQRLYVYLLFLVFPSHLGHHRALSRVPCTTQQVLMSHLFCAQQYVHINPNLLIYPCLLLPSLVSMFVLYFCISVSALQMSSSKAFFLDSTCMY